MQTNTCLNRNCNIFYLPVLKQNTFPILSLETHGKMDTIASSQYEILNEK